MGNIIKKKYNNEKDIKLDITLNKVCYMPGEQIIGSLDIQPKPGINETILNDTNVSMKIIQFQKYSYIEGSGEDSETKVVSDERDVFSENLDFINFKGANILSGINIPFSIQIPLEIHASVYYNGDCVKHFFSVEFPEIKAKRALMIIIKRFEKFSYENKLLKIPANAFGDFYKKKKFKYQGGKVTCLLKLPKNKFYYFEKIPFEIYLDRTELNMKVKSIKLRLNMNIYYNYKGNDKIHFMTEKKLELFTREYPVNNSLNKFEIKDYIQLQNDSKFSKYISVNDKYCRFEEMKKIEVDYNFNKIILMPFCFGGLINPEFILQVDIIYKQHRSTSNFSINIDFDDCQNNCINIEQSDKINNKLNNHENENKINNSSPKDTNSISEGDLKKNMAESEGFVVYDDDDFEKALFGDKNK